MHDADGHTRVPSNVREEPQNLITTKLGDQMLGKITVAKIGAAAGEGLVEGLVAKSPSLLTVIGQIVTPQTSMVGMSHGGKGWNMNGTSNRVATHLVEKIANVTTGGRFAKFWKGAEEGLDGTMFGAKTRKLDGTQIFCFAGKLRTKAHSEVAHGAVRD